MSTLIHNATNMIPLTSKKNTCDDHCSNGYSIYKYEHKHVEGIDDPKGILLTDALLETPLLF